MTREKTSTPDPSVDQPDLTSTPLLTHEVGSLDKPGWRVKAYAGKPLTDQDREELLGKLGGPIRSGYRYPVVVREKSEKGAHFDEGPFSHVLVFKPAQKVNLGAPLEVPVRGRVSGDIAVGSGDHSLRLQPFKVRDGTSLEVPLHSPQVQLEIAESQCLLRLRHVPFIGQSDDFHYRRCE